MKDATSVATGTHYSTPAESLLAHAVHSNVLYRTATLYQALFEVTSPVGTGYFKQSYASIFLAVEGGWGKVSAATKELLKEMKMQIKETGLLLADGSEAVDCKVTLVSIAQVSNPVTSGCLLLEAPLDLPEIESLDLEELIPFEDYDVYHEAALESEADGVTKDKHAVLRRAAQQRKRVFFVKHEGVKYDGDYLDGFYFIDASEEAVRERILESRESAEMHVEELDEYEADLKARDDKLKASITEHLKKRGRDTSPQDFEQLVKDITDAIKEAEEDKSEQD